MDVIKCNDPGDTERHVAKHTGCSTAIQSNHNGNMKNTSTCVNSRNYSVDEGGEVSSACGIEVDKREQVTRETNYSTERQYDS